MMKRMAVATLVIGAALTVLPAGASAQECGYDVGRAPAARYYRDGYGAREYRERVRYEERVNQWRAHERREHERWEHRNVRDGYWHR